MASTDTASEPSRFTEAQLAEMGMEYPPPPEVRCLHCGRRKAPFALLIAGKVVWISGECGCDQERAAKEEEEARKAAEKDRRYAEKLRAVGIPPRYQNAVIDSNEAAMFLAEFDSRPGSGLYIQGTCGSGKTSLACALARRLFDAKKRVLVTTAIDMLGEIQRTFDDSSPTFDVVRRYVECDLLVIDDMGKESAGDWAVRTLFQILNARYGEMRSTIVTSEYDPPNLGRRMSRQGFGDPATAILSRLKETCTRIERPDVDFRSLPGGYPGGRATSGTE